jgi:glutathione S-transferase fosA5
MRVTGINHVTLAVSQVDRSLTFYRDLLGFQVRAVWPKGAYLEAGSLWLCLSVDEQTRSAPHPDYSHIAFTVDEADFLHLSARLVAESRIWKQDSSEGASTYFLDPDGHKLEIHVGSLQSRLRHYRENPSKGVHVVDG